MSPKNQIRIERVEGTLMSVNSYVIEGPEGLIIVDGQLTVSDARAVRAIVDGFGRPVAAMVITHGHPDHYAGAATVLAGLDAPIIATARPTARCSAARPATSTRSSM
jgi:glyoxylase-like metal-dependent hydrolase (beta-lactamase superfamily II)